MMGCSSISRMVELRGMGASFLPGMGNQIVDGFGQFLRGERLDQEPTGAALHRLHRRAMAVERGDDQD